MGLNKQQAAAVKELFAGCPYFSEADALRLAERVRKAIGEKGGSILCRVEHVARSGMSRHISVAINDRNGLTVLNYTPFRTVFADRDRVEKSGSVYISGCGMDMLFEATYRLYCFFYPYGKNGQRRPYQDHLNRYRDY